MRHPALLLALVVLFTGCGKKPPSGREESPERKRDREAVRTALEAGTYRGAGQDVAVAPIPAKAEAAGPAYAWIDHVGLATIEKGTATLARFPEPATQGLPLYVKAMALDGANPVMLGDRGVFEISAGQRTDLGAPEDLLGLDTLAIAPDGTIWVGGDRGVAHRKGGEWTREKVEVPDLESIDFDGAGHVFLSSRNDVFVLDGAAWKPIVRTKVMTEGHSMRPWWHQTVVAPNGELWVLSCDQLMRIVAGKVTVVDLPEPGFSHGRFVGDTLVGKSCLTNSLVHIAMDGALTEVVPKARLEGYSQAIDGSGRLWVALRTMMLTVVGADGTRTEYPAGSLPALGGDIAALVVTGKGPDALPAATPSARATITGFVLTGGTPLPRISVELCKQPGTPAPTPCAKDASRVTGETDDKGAFHISAPLRSFQVVAKVDGHWYWLMNHECTGLDPNATCAIGTIETTKAMNPNEAAGLRFVSNHDGEPSPF